MCADSLHRLIFATCQEERGSWTVQRGPGRTWMSEAEEWQRGWQDGDEEEVSELSVWTLKAVVGMLAVLFQFVISHRTSSVNRSDWLVLWRAPPAVTLSLSIREETVRNAHLLIHPWRLSSAHKPDDPKSKVWSVRYVIFFFYIKSFYVLPCGSISNHRWPNTP